VSALTALLVSSALASDPSWVSAAPGQVNIGVYSGYPWHGVRAVYAPRGPLAAVAQVETARFQRTESRLGLQRPWSISGNWSVVASVAGGWVHQLGEVSRQGPQVAALVSVSRTGRVEPYVSIYNRQLFDLQPVQTVGISGTETVWTQTRFGSRGGSVGVRVPIRSQLCLDLAMQGGNIDAIFAIPSFSAGISWRTSP